MTDQQLQIKLAKLLPEKILSHKEDVIVGFISQDECEHERQHIFRWKNTNNSDIEEDWFELTDQEWLHVCWLIVCASAKHDFSKRIEARAHWLDIPVCKLQWQDWAEEIMFIGPEDEDSFRPKQRARAVKGKQT